MATQSLNTYCLFPKTATAFYVNYTSQPIFACIIPPIKKTITVEQGFSDFFGEHCRTCQYYKSTQDVMSEFAQKYLRQLDNTSELYTEYKKSGKCPGTPKEMQYSCKKNLSFSETENLDIQTYSQFWIYKTGESTTDKFSMCVLKETEDSSLYLKPYTMANVYDSSRVCWGNNNKIPKDLRCAYNLFWTSPFNRDLVGNFQYSIQNTLRSYSPENSDLEWKDTTQAFFGQHVLFKVRNSGFADGAIVSYDPKVIAILPKSCLDEIRGRQVAVGWIRQGLGKSWFINFNGFLTVKSGLVKGTSKLLPLGYVKDIV